MNRVLIGLCFTALSAFPQAVPGQPSKTGSVDGTVQDEAKKPIPDAKITIMDSKKAVVLGSPQTSDAKGKFQVSSLSADTYTISVAAAGFEPNNQEVSVAATALAVPVTLKQKTDSVAKGSFSGSLQDADNKPIPNAKITLFNAKNEDKGHPSSYQDGKFKFTSLSKGDYTVTAEADGYETTKPKAVSVADSAVAEQLVLTMKHRQPTIKEGCVLSWLWAVLGFYLVATLAARYNNIADVNRYQLEAEIDKKENRADAIQDQSVKGRAHSLVKKAKELLEKARSEKPRTFFFWTRGHEISAYVLLHEADRLIVSTYDDDQTYARLQIAAQELRPDYAKVADMVDAALLAHGTAKPPSVQYMQALLSQALKLVYEGREQSYELIFSWTNKVFALLFIAPVVLLAIAGTSSNAILILMGLAGGLVSRLLRGARGTEIPHDYGASWTTLFMSPIYGAFAGWFGVLILAALKNLGVLGDALKLDWNKGSGETLLALAFVFGFSERLFTNVTDALEKAVNNNLNKSAATPPGAPAGVGGNTAAPPSDGDPKITSIPYAFKAKPWKLEGKNLKGVTKVELDHLLGSVTVVSTNTDMLALQLAESVNPGSYHLFLNDGKSDQGVVIVPNWSIDTLEWLNNALTVKGKLLPQVGEVGLRKGSATALTLTKKTSGNDTVLTASPAAPPEPGDYQLLIDKIPTGDLVSVPNPKITSIPYAFKGKPWKLVGTNLLGVTKVELDEKTGLVTIDDKKSDSTTLELTIADITAAGPHLLFVNGKEVLGHVVVPEWTITKAGWSTNGLSVDGTLLTKIKAITLQKTGDAKVDLIIDKTSTDANLTAKPAPALTLPVGGYQLLVDNIWTGDIVKV